MLRASTRATYFIFYNNKRYFKRDFEMFYSLDPDKKNGIAYGCFCYCNTVKI